MNTTWMLARRRVSLLYMDIEHCDDTSPASIELQLPRCGVSDRFTCIHSTRERREERRTNAPTSRQCFSIRRDSATFSPTSVHAGEVSRILARSPLTLRTRPPAEMEPMMISNSSFLSVWTPWFVSCLPSGRRGIGGVGRGRFRVLGVGVGRVRNEAGMKSNSYLCTPSEVSRQRPIPVPPADLHDRASGRS
jgi:hypothetical protein